MTVGLGASAAMEADEVDMEKRGEKGREEESGDHWHVGPACLFNLSRQLKLDIILAKTSDDLVL